MMVWIGLLLGLVVLAGLMVYGWPVPRKDFAQLSAIEADNDPLVPPVLRDLLRETYPSARVVTLQQVGHFPYLNEPVTCTQLVRSHILGEDRREHG